MDAPNEVIHQSTRLRVMSALHALPPRQLLGFVPLRRITGATDGNLGSHLTTLENAGYVKIVKDFRRPQASHPSRDHGEGDGATLKIMSVTCSRSWTVISTIPDGYPACAAANRSDARVDRILRQVTVQQWWEQCREAAGHKGRL